MICLLIENNIFDGLYKKIVAYDNDIPLRDFEWFERDSFKRIFENLLDDVLEFGVLSKFYSHYQHATSIDSYYRTILKPDLELSSDLWREAQNNSKVLGTNSIFEPYCYSIFQQGSNRENLLSDYVWKQNNQNIYLEKLGMFEITNEGDIFPHRFSPTNNLLT